MASKLNVDKIARGSGTPEFTWPTADGTAGQAMVTNASGVLSFADAGPSLTGSTNTWIPTITGANALTGTANFTYDGNTLDVKNSGTASSINLYCETGNAHYIKLKSGPHASATSYTLTLPNAPPSTNGQHLAATTAGVASWADPPAGITQASQWRLTSAATGAQNPISANLEEVDTDSYTRIGSAMTESSGVFTFPVTGIWRQSQPNTRTGSTVHFMKKKLVAHSEISAQGSPGRFPVICQLSTNIRFAQHLYMFLLRLICFKHFENNKLQIWAPDRGLNFGLIYSLCLLFGGNF